MEERRRKKAACMLSFCKMATETLNVLVAPLVLYHKRRKKRKFVTSWHWFKRSRCVHWSEQEFAEARQLALKQEDKENCLRALEDLERQQTGRCIQSQEPVLPRPRCPREPLTREPCCVCADEEPVGWTSMANCKHSLCVECYLLMKQHRSPLLCPLCRQSIQSIHWKGMEM
jgi:hypothetical protein